MNFSKKNNEFNIENKNSMSKTLKVLILTLFVSASVFAQRPDREKIKSLKIAHITEQVDLTKEEAQKFWPIYNANEEAEHKLREQSSFRKKDQKSKDFTEQEAKAFLLNIESIENKKQALRSKMLNDLLDIMPAKKIMKYYQAERSFRRKMIEEYKSRHSRKKDIRN
jgi:hypothetical protein